MKPKAIVSACILGELCRYDAQTKEIPVVLEALAEYEIIPFCPEAPLFGTPRERISVVAIAGDERIVTEETKRDVTQMLQEQINTFIASNPEVEKIVLKSKSPSCGYKTTPIFNEKKELIHLGNGIAAKLFEQHYKAVPIEDEFTL